MNIVTFDTLSSEKRLREKGFTPEQAEAMAEELRIAHNFDVDCFVPKPEVEIFKGRMKNDFKILEALIETKIQLLEQRLIIKLGTMMIALAAFLSAIKFFG